MPARLTLPPFPRLLPPSPCRSATRRVQGDMHVLSGAAGLTYFEYSTGGGGGRGAGRPRGGANKPPGKLAKMAKKYG